MRKLLQPNIFLAICVKLQNSYSNFNFAFQRDLKWNARAHSLCSLSYELIRSISSIRFCNVLANACFPFAEFGYLCVNSIREVSGHLLVRGVFLIVAAANIAGLFRHQRWNRKMLGSSQTRITYQMEVPHALSNLCEIWWLNMHLCMKKNDNEHYYLLQNHKWPGV